MAFFAFGVAGLTDAAEDRVDFAREVLPILSNKCFVCHGPDTRKKDDLRLDSFEAATADRGGYQAIDPESPDESELLFRIHDEEDPMPPEDAEKQLTDAERELLSRWVRQGGAYEKHWAFVPPRKQRPAGSAEGADLPPVDAAIDAFVAARQRAAGIDFAPEADRAVLARRAALILTGLPPEPDRLAAFLADDRSGAYERFVDELMRDPRFGEHQARYWLDAVRYGDTHGLHLDNRRGIFPYRDWVVRAFNQNLPLDDFIVWQLAGDLLPDPTLGQRVATGFVRLNPSTSEGGVIPEEFQAKNNFDRVETLGTVLLGMTMSCARCHTHKYDPILQTEYFQLMAFFQSTAESPLDGNSYTYPPVARVPADQEAWDEWEALESQLDRLVATAAQGLAAGDEGRLAALVADHAESRGHWKASGWRVAGAGEDEPKPAEGLPGQSKLDLPESGGHLVVEVDVDVSEARTLWLTFTGGAGSRVIVDAVPAASGEGGAALVDGENAVPLTLAAGTHAVRIEIEGTGGGGKVAAALEDPWKAVADSGGWDAAEPRHRLRLLADPAGPFAGLGLRDEAIAVGRRIRSAQARFTTSLVAEELAQPRPTRLLDRGEYDRPVGDPLEPDVLAVMGSLPEGAPRNRLGLARWLTSDEHPLVARVLVNRIWQRVFGAGLVRTPEDFGLQGEQPTHPRLLDWLAVELRESGWDLRHMLRLMVTSRTFRQDSAWRDDVDDPGNRLWARGPAHRLDAEVLRDLGLWASGLLDPHMGGEGVKPYQPAGMWKALAHPASNTKEYVRDEGRRLYRRSLYVYWKRTSPHPMMTLFDAPDRESSCVRRSRTNTALQSLGLLNETQRIEMARALAEQLIRETDADGPRFDSLFTRLASRPPEDPERAACESLLQSMRSRYADDREGALALLTTGEAPRDESLDPAEHAAWTQLCVTVLASDAAILLY